MIRNHVAELSIRLDSGNSGPSGSDVLLDHSATLMSKDACEVALRYGGNEALPDGLICTDAHADRSSTCLVMNLVHFK